MSNESRSLSAAIASKTYATIAADTNLLTALEADGITSPARRIRVQVAGNVSVKYESGVTDTFPMFAGEVLEGQFVTIFTSGTTATGVTVFW